MPYASLLLTAISLLNAIMKSLRLANDDMIACSSCVGLRRTTRNEQGKRAGKNSACFAWQQVTLDLPSFTFDQLQFKFGAILKFSLEARSLTRKRA
jgi:hypothetical protein